MDTFKKYLVDAPFPVIVFSGPDLVYAFINRAAYSLRHRPEYVGRRLVDVIPNVVDSPGYDALVGVMESRVPFVGTEIPVRNDWDGSGMETEKFFDCSLQPMADGQVMSVFVDVTDRVTSRMASESQLEALEQALRSKEDFLSVASHELRTPLTSLILQVQSLRGALGSNPAYSRRLDMMEKSAKRLNSLLDSLMSASRASDTSLPSPGGLDLLEVARDAAEYTAAGAAVQVDGEPCRGPWDRDKLEHVAANLISNAVKYGRGLPVRVEVRREGRSAVLLVRDQGIGVPPSDRERIFKKFERATSSSAYGGLGLGLWVVDQAVKSMGGTVAVSDAPGGGTEFRVALPTGEP